MDKVTRLILLNQYRLLKSTNEISTTDADNAITALRNGYPLDIQQIVDSEVWGEVAAEVCVEVRSILEMYRHINNSLIRLSDGAQETARASHWFSFRGFDGNNESDYYAYATYLLEDCGLWRESYTKGESLNTHSPTLAKYRAMLDAHKGKKTHIWMSGDEVMKILSTE